MAMLPLFPEMETNLNAPLAERMRPLTLDEILGQDHLLGADKVLRHLIEQDQVSSLILWGPPGSGKTTIAHLVALKTKAHFQKFSAVTSGIAEVKKVMQEAEHRNRSQGQKTILFIDETHRFNKSQQDAFLPYVERGDIILVGATTENPSFHVINALLSRSRVFVLNPLTLPVIIALLKRALKSELSSAQIAINDDLLSEIANFSNGDARIALNALEILVLHVRGKKQKAASLPDLEEALQHKTLQHDKQGDDHFNSISALHKCLRDSDADAALYYMGRMLESGEDPLYIVRRLIRFASEDIGLADPQALVQAVAAQQATHFLGMPECNVILAQAVVYLAKAPKSNALYTGYQLVQEDIYKTINEPVPLVIRNAPTRLMKDIGYGKGYKYAHDFPEAAVEQEHLPPSLKGHIYYQPTSRGFEARYKKNTQAEPSPTNTAQ